MRWIGNRAVSRMKLVCVCPFSDVARDFRNIASATRQPGAQEQLVRPIATNLFVNLVSRELYPYVPEVVEFFLPVVGVDSAFTFKRQKFLNGFFVNIGPIMAKHSHLKF